MWKKNIVITMMITVLLLLSACAAKRNDEATNGTHAIPKERAETVAQKVADKNEGTVVRGDVVGSLKSTYQIAIDAYVVKNDNLDVEIRYPRIVNLGNDELQEIINGIIKQEAVPLRFFNSLENDRKFTMRLNCRVTWQSDRLLSIQYVGRTYARGAPYSPNEFDTINIDVVRGKKLELKNLVRIDESFAEKIRGEGIRTVSPHAGKFSGRDIFVDMRRETIKETMESFNSADTLDEKGRKYGTCSYFTPHALGISVPVIHAIGDYANFEIKYEDIAEHIKLENEVWKDFFPDGVRKQ